MTNVATVGDNHPPSHLDCAGEFIQQFSRFMADHPAVTDGESASATKEWIDRARMTAQDLDSERDGLVRPMNNTVRSINERYKAVSGPLARLQDAAKSRLATYLREVEERRRRDAEAARMRAEEEARIAREKAAAEAAAKANAAVGEVVDVGQAIVDTDAAVSAAQRADDIARRAERDAENTRVGGGFGRAAALRTVEIWTVSDPFGAILQMGTSEGINQEIIKAAKAWKKAHGSLPNGVSVTTERTL